MAPGNLRKSMTNISHRDYLTLRRRHKAFASASRNLIHGIVSNGNVNTQICDLDSYTNAYFSLATANKNCWKIFRSGPWQFKKVRDCHTKELLKLTYIFTQERLGNKGLCDISWQEEKLGFPPTAFNFLAAFLKKNYLRQVPCEGLAVLFPRCFFLASHTT